MRREALAGMPREYFTNTTIEKMKPRRSLPEFRFVGQLPVPLLTHPTAAPESGTRNLGILIATVEAGTWAERYQ